MSIDKTVTVGTLALHERSGGARWRSNTRRKTLRLTGQESSPGLDGANVTAVSWRMQLFEGLLDSDAPIPVTFDEKVGLDGFYLPVGVDVTPTSVADQSMLAVDWTIDLEPVHNSTQFQTRTTGIARGGFTGEPWHAVPAEAVGYDTGSTVPGSITREGQRGDATVYRDIPAGVSPRWFCSPSDFLNIAPRIDAFSFPAVGRVIAQTGALGFTLDNGITRCIVPAGVTFQLGTWGGTAFEGSEDFTVKIGATSLGNADRHHVLRSTPDEIVMRLFYDDAPGRHEVDIAMRAGSRYVTVVVKTHTAADLKIESGTGGGVAFASNQAARANANNADGHRWAMGTAESINVPAATGITKASATSFAAWVGILHDGGAAQAGDAGIDLHDQYIEQPAVETRAVML